LGDVHHREPAGVTDGRVASLVFVHLTLRVAHGPMIEAILYQLQILRDQRYVRFVCNNVEEMTDKVDAVQHTVLVWLLKPFYQGSEEIEGFSPNVVAGVA